MKRAPRLQLGLHIGVINWACGGRRMSTSPLLLQFYKPRGVINMQRELQKDAITRSQSDAKLCPHTWPHSDLGPPCQKKTRKKGDMISRDSDAAESKAPSRFAEPRPKNDRLSCRKDFSPHPHVSQQNLKTSQRRMGWSRLKAARDEDSWADRDNKI